MNRMLMLMVFTMCGPILASADEVDGKNREADRTAIRKATRDFVNAFEKGDAAQAATHLTMEAELLPDDAPAIHSRDAIQKAFAGHFAKFPQQKITLDAETLNFTSRDTATEEGQMKTSVEKIAPTTQRYSLLHVREDGKWLIATIREWPAEESGLPDLDWLVGSWQSKRDDAEIHTTYEWLGNKAFLRGNITMRQKDRTLSAMQLIGADPATGELTIWIFEADGGVAQGTCTREGDTWIFETHGLQGDGGELGCKNLLVRVNNDTITWQPINLKYGDEQIGDLPPLKVTRVKAAK
jgi:uncharacterized protein (TIGR02246 family)